MTTILGIFIAIISIVVATVMDGNSFGALIGPSSLLLVVLGSIGVSLSGFQVADVKKVPKGIILSFKGKEPDPGEAIDRLMKFAEIARKEGVLALEAQLEALEAVTVDAGEAHHVGRQRHLRVVALALRQGEDPPETEGADALDLRRVELALHPHEGAVRRQGGGQPLAVEIEDAGQKLGGFEKDDRPGVPGHSAPIRLGVVGRLGLIPGLAQ
mgnify:CR=1 FL=1